jgi:Methyltransferase domain
VASRNILVPSDRPQPRGRLDMTITDGLDIVQRLLTDKPSFHLDGEARWDALPGALEAIRSTVGVGDSTIETGVGASTVVFAACGANHTAISPAPSEHQLVRNYCQQIGVDHSRINFIVGLSDDVLPSFLGRDRTLDVAFIDGAHSFPFPEVDWYYITRSLRIGGKLLMDDIPIPAVAQVFRHMRLESNWRLDGVLDDRTAAFTMLAPPEPELWSRQPFNKGYPDLSFVSPPKRLRLKAAYRVQQMRRSIGQRYPSLRRIYNRPA